MTFEARIAGYLANSAITALVSTRAYPITAGEQTALPYLVWQRISTVPVVGHEASTTLEEIGIQVTCFAQTHAGACAIRRAVRSVIEGNHAEGPAVYSNAQDIGHDDNLRVFAVSCDFEIWHDDVS